MARSPLLLPRAGQSVFGVVGALQDPRKDVLTIRNLFHDRIAIRLDEPEQARIVFTVLAARPAAYRCGVTDATELSHLPRRARPVRAPSRT
jgi:hypothetical protein